VRPYQPHGFVGAIREPPVICKNLKCTLDDTLAEVLIPDHISNAQIFQRDTVIGLHQLGAEFIQIVFALIGNMFVLALDSAHCFASVLAPALCPRQFAGIPRRLTGLDAPKERLERGIDLFHKTLCGLAEHLNVLRCVVALAMLQPSTLSL